MRGVWLALALMGCDRGAQECVQATWFIDGDGDGYGSGGPQTDCADRRPANGVNIPGDCNDRDRTVSPAATETCNTFDDDCDNRIDDVDPDVDPATMDVFFVDADGDGFGDDDEPRLACEQPEGTVWDGGDCNDADSAIRPGAVETCDDLVDANCDGVFPTDDADRDGVEACADCDDADNRIGEAPTWYGDGDGDGYGSDLRFEVQCEAPVGFVDNAEDCDDKERAVNPGAEESCDTVDNDCDGAIDDFDDDVVDQLTWYADNDDDGLGDVADARQACEAPPSSVSNADDCDDNNAEVGLLTPFYPDDDIDGAGDETATATLACYVPDGFVDNRDDCDDTDPALNPLTQWFEDGDDDGYGNANVFLQQCDPLTGHTRDDTDCDDTTHLVHPGRFDFGDNVDNDCDDATDEDVGTETYDSTDLQSLVDAECSACHDPPNGNALDMSDVYGATVNVAPPSGAVTLDLIEPGDLRNSYLWHKLQGTQSTVGGAGVQMPQGSAPLSDADLAVFETWILEGAIQ